MEEALRYFRAYETWIYLVLGALAFWQIRKFILAWEEVRGAVFGMERENAQARLNQAATMLVLILAIAVTEFLLVSFIIPSIPGASPLPSPTIDLLATATTTLPFEPSGIEQATQVAPASAGEETPVDGCIPGQVMLSSPQNGEQISGVVKIIGTADIPDFGFYKYEISRPGETIWLSINAGERIVQEDELGEWITTTLIPGEYRLRLVVVDNQGISLLPCEIRVHVVATEP